MNGAVLHLELPLIYQNVRPIIFHSYYTKKGSLIPTEAALLETCSNIPNSKPNLMLYLANLNSILYGGLSLDNGLLALP